MAAMMADVPVVVSGRYTNLAQRRGFGGSQAVLRALRVRCVAEGASVKGRAESGDPGGRTVCPPLVP